MYKNTQAPEAGITPLDMSRFIKKIRSDNQGCWRWIGAIGGTGYGTFKVSGTYWRAHRFAYTFWVGAIPDGMHLDHLCRVPSCVNPEHLEPVTNAENTRRGLAGSQHSAKTHCAKGHEYDEQNTKFYRRKDGRVQRQCRACDRVRSVGKRKRLAR